MAGLIAALHIIGWFILIAVVVPRHLSDGAKTFGIGVGVTAYLLGMRHAFDADHIAAIDNTTRKLMGEGQRPLSVGFWFSLGHSSIVFALAFLLSIGVQSLAAPIADANSALHSVTGLVGALISGSFLYGIALLNILALADLWRGRRRSRADSEGAVLLEQKLRSGGLVSRLLRPMMAVIARPWQMYLVGMLFGLGFDTATEIALLVLTGSGAASGLPWYALLCLPVLFAAGMSLLDTVDGCCMAYAYGWASSNATRTAYYNMFITALSVAVAMLVGTLEIMGLVSDQLRLDGAFWSWISEVDLNRLGAAIVGLFVATWIIAAAVWKIAPIDRRRRPPRGLPMA